MPSSRSPEHEGEAVLNRHTVLVTDTLAESGLELLRSHDDIDLQYRPGLKGKELLDATAEADALVTRSGTPVTEELLAAGKRLRVVGRAGVGLDNVDVDAATRQGVLVVNAPTANIISATEHTMALLLSTCRSIAEADASVRRGEWVRSRFMGIELNGKTIGIVGLGRIGSGIARRVREFGMRVLAYDPYVPRTSGERVGAELTTLDRLLGESDFITVHTPLTDETKGMIGAAEIAKTRAGVVMINCARGGIYDEAALAEALQNGHVRAAGIDVFADEPPAKENPLLTAPNVVLTPHIGANTLEAQDRVAVQTAEMVVEALRGSIFVSAVNLPFEGVADAADAPFVALSERLGILAAQVLDEPLIRVEVETRGIDARLSRLLLVAGVKGVLTPHLSNTINFVNAEAVADSRGIDIRSTLHPTIVDYANLLTLRASGESRSVCITGTVFSERNLRVVSIDSFRVEFDPAGCLLYMINRDVPGVIGKVGTILGDRDVNIAEYNLARDAERGRALAIVTIDSAIDPQTLEFLRSLREMEDVRLIRV